MPWSWAALGEAAAWSSAPVLDQLFRGSLSQLSQRMSTYFQTTFYFTPSKDRLLPSDTLHFRSRRVRSPQAPLVRSFGFQLRGGDNAPAPITTRPRTVTAKDADLSKLIAPPEGFVFVRQAFRYGVPPHLGWASMGCFYQTLQVALTSCLSRVFATQKHCQQRCQRVHR